MRYVVIGCAVAAMVALSARTEASPRQLKILEAPSSSTLTGQYGVASWYGPQFQGCLTASGVPFNENALTCAHRKLPLGTKIKVTNLLNHRTLILKVNDRGPVPRGRILDVSREAAKRLGFLGTGLTHVRIQIMSFPRNLLASRALGTSSNLNLN